MVKETLKLRCELREKLRSSKRSQVYKLIPKVTSDEYKSKPVDEWVAWAVETYEEDKPKPDGYLSWSKEQKKEWILSLPVKKA